MILASLTQQALPSIVENLIFVCSGSAVAVYVQPFFSNPGDAFSSLAPFSPNLFARYHKFEAMRKQQTNTCNDATPPHRVFWLLVNAFTADLESFSPFPLVDVLLNQAVSRENKRLPSQAASQTFTPQSVIPSTQRSCSKLCHRCVSPTVFALRDLLTKHLILLPLGSRKACRGGGHWMVVHLPTSLEQRCVKSCLYFIRLNRYAETLVAK